MRSASAIHYLESVGFNNLVNLTGGIDAWAREVDDEMEIY
jgi:adenylyltransferase/sulfurtransferase